MDFESLRAHMGNVMKISVYLLMYLSVLQAAQCLDDEGAQYPCKISYMYTSPYLAVEALEIYFRIHTSILKSVQRTTSEDNYKLYTEVSVHYKITYVLMICMVLLKYCSADPCLDENESFVYSHCKDILSSLL